MLQQLKGEEGKGEEEEELKVSERDEGFVEGGK